MKRINIKEYNTSMGILIDVQNPVEYAKNHYSGSKNIPYEKLMLHYKELLDKNKRYYIICNKGVKSRKAVSILEFYGYDVTQVSYE